MNEQQMNELEMNELEMKKQQMNERETNEQRLNLMRELAKALALAQAAVLASDGEKLQLQTEREQRLCRTLLVLGESNGESHADEFGTSRAAGFESDAAFPPTSRQGSQELKKLGLQIRHLNLIQAALLRRARRTLEILTGLRASRSPTYPALGPERTLLAP